MWDFAVFVFIHTAALSTLLFRVSVCNVIVFRMCYVQSCWLRNTSSSLKCWGNAEATMRVFCLRSAGPDLRNILYIIPINVPVMFQLPLAPLFVCEKWIRLQKNVRHTSFVNVFSRIPSSPVTCSFARSCSCIRKSIVSQLEVFSHTLFLQISNNLSSENGTQCCRAYLGYKEKRTNVHDLKRALAKKKGLKDGVLIESNIEEILYCVGLRVYDVSGHWR